MTATPQQSLENWRAHHVFYHADRNQLIREVAAPLMQQLYKDGLIDRFFFVRYALGGPHVRLRWRLTSEAREFEANALLAEKASEFISRCPSPVSLSGEEIRLNNHSLLGVDPAAGLNVDQVYPDNSCHSVPVEFETERYGGIFKLRYSLDLFALSSIHIFQLLNRPDQRESRKRPTMLNLTMRLALAFSGGDPDTFVDLTGYGVRLMGERFAPCLEHADLVFTRCASEMVPTLKKEINRLLASPYSYTTDWLTGASCHFWFYFNELPRSSFREIAASHIHMTANRFGITNAEEVYLSRLLWRGINAIRAEMPEDWESWWNAYPEWRFLQGPFDTIVTAALSDFAAANMNSSELDGVAISKE